MSEARHRPVPVLGWDIGGVNTKVALVSGGRVLAAHQRPFELQRAPGALVPLLRELAGSLDPRVEAAHAVTMTAELSQMFRTKRDGVAFVLDAVDAAFPGAWIRVWTVDGRWLPTAQAGREPLAVAASNWAAAAAEAARVRSDALFVDVGTTTTDLVPIAVGRVSAAGLTDPDRLASGELVYTGAVRTPAEAILSEVTIGDATFGVSAEGFAVAGDAHVWRGDLAPEAYTVPTPDGRPATREFAGERLARLVCADRTMLDELALTQIADAISRAQVTRLASSMRRVLGRHPSISTALVTGLGAFLGEAAARAAGLAVERLSASIGESAARCAPAASVALLLERALDCERNPPRRPRHTRDAAAASLTGAPAADRGARGAPAVVKLGGGILSTPGHFDAVLALLDAAVGCAVLVVPGGGPFAEAVRDADRRLRIGDDAAHWMAVLAMDQFAHLITSRLARGVLVTDPAGAAVALADGRLPVLAPFRWLRESDPLPHTWEVTSDSIAAWVAGAIGAGRLGLIKPPGAGGPGCVDAAFARVVPAGLDVALLPADDLTALRRLLGGPAAGVT